MKNKKTKIKPVIFIYLVIAIFFVSYAAGILPFNLFLLLIVYSGLYLVVVKERKTVKILTDLIILNFLISYENLLKLIKRKLMPISRSLLFLKILIFLDYKLPKLVHSVLLFLSVKLPRKIRRAAKLTLKIIVYSIIDLLDLAISFVLKLISTINRIIIKLFDLINSSVTKLLNLTNSFISEFRLIFNKLTIVYLSKKATLTRFAGIAVFVLIILFFFIGVKPGEESIKFVGAVGEACTYNAFCSLYGEPYCDAENTANEGLKGLESDNLVCFSAAACAGGLFKCGSYDGDCQYDAGSADNCDDYSEGSSIQIGDPGYPGYCDANCGYHQAPTIQVQNTFVNCSAGHCFNVTAGVQDLDGGSDITRTNISTTSGTCQHYSNTTSGNYFNVTFNCSGTALTSTNIIIGFNDSGGAYIATTQSSNVYPNNVPTIQVQNTFVNCSAGHCFNVTAGVRDLDGGSDIRKTNISVSNGNCNNILNSTSGNYFNSTWNCSGTALTSTNIIIGFNDSGGAYVQTTQSSNVYPNHAPTIQVQNTFVNCSAGHCFNVTAGVRDLDGGFDITKTNISTTSGTCQHYSNTTTGNYFNVTYNCSGTALTSTNIIIGFNDSGGAYVSSTLSANTYPNQAPAQPSLTSPANQSVQSTVDVTINWSSTDADSDTITFYIYFLNTTPITYNSSTQNLYKSYTNLADAQTYYWKIIAGDGTDNSTESETRQFRIDISAPTYSDNSTSSTSAGQPIEHRLKWTENVGLSGYIFQFCNGTWNKTHCGGETENWADSNCNYRSLLTFDNSASFENLTNFPVMVKLNSSRIFYTKTSATDIRFYDDDNSTLLSKETELWNNSGDSFIWVKVPLLENTTNDFIWAYYKCSNTNSDDATNVWDSDYKAVWHMTEVNATDSTSNNNNGTESGGVAYTGLGKIDGADDFDGSNDYVNCSNSSSLNSINNNITITAWIYPKGWGEYTASGFGRIVDKGKFLMFLNSNGQPSYNNYSLVFYIYLNNGTGFPSDTPLDSISLNTWQHVAATYDNNSVKIYINGKSQNPSYMSGPPPDVIGNHSANELFIGESAAQNRAFNGTIDEVRISNISRSASWINASYLIMSDQFINYGNEESKGGWNNDSWVAFSTNPDWSNVTKTVSSTVGATIAWCVHANGTSNKWNTTSCENPFSYVTVSYILPQLFNVSTDRSSYYKDETITFISYVNGSLTGALLIDNSSGFENCNYSVRTGCIAYSSNIALTQSPQQLNATMTASSNTTWYAKVCDNAGSCDSIILYDFSDLSNKNAYEKDGVPSSPDDYDSEATSADYANIGSSNDNRWITALATGDGEFDTQIFKFNLSEDSSQISSLNITWEGYGEHQTGYYTNISIWNWSSSTWYELDKKDFTSEADDTLNKTISSGASDFVNSTTKQVVIKVSSRKYALKFSSISAGGYHTCGVLVNGSAMCWGYNAFGQLGDGTEDTDRLYPVYVNSSKNFTSVSAGGTHTCGRLVNGSLMCWGAGTSGRLGYGGTSQQNNPVYVNSNNNFTSVSAGGTHTCGRLVNGSLMCWGAGGNGQLGDGYISNRNNPVYVNSSENFTSVSAGSSHTCGVLVNGSAMCWGSGSYGQLGYGGTTQQNNSVYVNSNENFTSVSAGSIHTCGRLVNGSLMCWGYNGNGGLGIGNTTTMYVPTMVKSSENFISVSAGYVFTCGELVNGSLMCWGYNGYGQIGDGTVASNNLPVYVNSSESFTSVSAGQSHTCGILDNKAVNCWGLNDYGQLGYGKSGKEVNPVYVDSSENFTSVSAGYYHTCGRLVNGSLMCWGEGDYGRLGYGSTSDKYSPYPVDSNENFSSVSAGYDFTCGRLVNGSLMCWGEGAYGRLGYGSTTDKYSPVSVNSNNNFMSVSAGGTHTCGRLVNGSLMCWGYNYYGQLGNGTAGSQSAYNPIYVNSSENFTSVSAGYSDTCGVLVNGSVMCWGYNNFGQLGDGTIIQRNNSVYVNSGKNFTSVSAGYYHTCGSLVNGSLMCWGYNNAGQLGIGNTTNMYVPTMVKSSENFTSVSVGYAHTCGRLINGSLMCWGSNNVGQLGDGTYNTNRLIPVYVNSSENISSVSAGYYHTCGVLVNGSLMCWGQNYYGQVGTGELNYYKPNPTSIVYLYSPFLYAFKDGRYAFVSDFITGASSPEKEYTSFIDVTGKTDIVDKRIKLKITEEMDETAYIDRVYLRVDSGGDNERIIELDSITNADIELLKYSDDNYLVMEQGAEHYLEFNAPEAYDKIEFASEGYYIEHMRNDFNAVPTAVSYESHNSVHTDYIKLEFPAMGTFEVNYTSPNLLNVSTDRSSYYKNNTVTFISYVNGSIKGGALLIDNSSGFENCNYSVRTGCIAYSSNITLTPDPQQLNATMTASSNTTWYARVCDNSGSCDSIISYDFSDLSNKNAYEKDGVPSSPDDYDSEATSSDYANIGSSNDNRWITALATGDGEFDTQIFKFNFSTSQLDSLNITWEGYGEHQTGYYTNISIWNWSSSTWYELDKKDFTSEADDTLNGTISSGAADFVNSTTKQVVIKVSSRKYNLQFSSVSLGEYHTCGVLVNGSVMCWGINNYGQVGDGTEDTDRLNPVYVNTSKTFVNISAGGSHTCGRLVNGSLMCWGYNTYGQIGDGTIIQRNNPVYVNSNKNFTSVSVGERHTCGVLINGSLMCWGSGTYGRLGYGGTSQQNNPVNVNSSENFTSVSAGSYHTCGVLVNGSLMCWGYNSLGQIGDGTIIQRNNSVYVNSSENFTSVSAGYQHSCGSLVNGSLMCWGDNSYGQIGDGTIIQRNNSVYVNSRENFTSVSTGYQHSCGRLINGSLMCWGDNSYGLIGDGTIIQRNNPVYVNSSESFTSVDAGRGHTCGILDNEVVNCWGQNLYGQLGYGKSGKEVNPVYVNSSESFASVFTWAQHTCGVLTNGSVMCWGLGTSGQLGYGGISNKYGPYPVNSNENFTFVSTGLQHTCGRLVNGSLMCWGESGYGQLGYGSTTDKYSPISVNSNENFTSVDLGYYHTCGVLVNGSVMCWGRNNYGQLGNGTAGSQQAYNPIYVNSSENFTSVDLGYYHTCGRLVNGSVMCWGYNSYGQIGDGTIIQRNNSVYVNSDKNFTSVSAGQYHTCGRLINGSLMCWGYNNVGQLGIGNTTNMYVPTMVKSSENFTSVSAGFSHTCGRLVNGSVMCWGDNSYGQIGDGTYGTSRLNPVSINSTNSFGSVSAGQYHTCGRLVNGSLMCWGQSANGQLGTGELNYYKLSPVLVVYSYSPFLYVFRNGRYEFVSDFISGASSPEKEYTSFVDVTNSFEIVEGKVKLKITEEMDETAYIDRVYLRVDSGLESERIVEIDSLSGADINLLKESDDNYLVMEQGEEHYLEFNAPEVYDKIEFASEGYYIQHSDYLGMQEGIESFSSVPTPVSYNPQVSHNSLHTDYIKLDVPAMGSFTVGINTLPTITANATSPATVYTNTDFKLNLTITDPNADQTLTGYVQFYVNNTANGSIQSQTATNGTSTLIGTLGSGNFSKGYNLIAEFWAGDGTDNTTKENATQAIVQNSAPTQPTLTSPANQSIQSTVDVTINWSSTDADSDTITYYIYFLNTTPITYNSSTQNLYKSYTNLADSQTYYWKIIAGDGIDNSTESETRQFIIDISAPTYSDNSTSSTSAGQPIEHRLKWTDNVELSGYIFSWYNGTNWTQINNSGDKESGEQSFLGERGANYTSSQCGTTICYGSNGCTNYNLIGDSCSGAPACDGTETINNIWLNGTAFKIGDTINVTAEIESYESGEHIGFHYYNGSIWDTFCEYTTTAAETKNYSRTFNITGPKGTQFIRVSIISISGICDNCPDTNYGDFDDINFTISGDGPTDTNKTAVEYSNVMTGGYEILDNITVTVYTSYYNTSGSIQNNNANATLWLEIYNGSDWLDEGDLDVNEIGNFSKTITTSSILTGWQTEANRDIKISARMLDYNSSTNYDTISWTDVWIDISSQQEFLNDSFVGFSGPINWSNVTKTITSTVGATIKWCVYANDTSNKWNTTSCENPFSYVTTAAPTITAYVTKPDIVYTNTDWMLNLTIIDLDNITIIAYTQFYVNGIASGSKHSLVVLNNTNTNVANLSSSSFNKGATLIAEFWAGDGTVNTTKENTSSVTVQPLNLQLFNVSTDSSSYYHGDTVTFISYVNGSLTAALLIDDSSGFENCNYTLRTGCIAYSDNVSLTASPQQLNATMTASSNTTWYAQVCDDDGSCDKMISYDFTDLTNKNAYEKLGVPSSPDDYDSEATSADYANIVSSNDNRWVTALATENGEFDTQIFKFNLSENTSQISSLNITWEGYGDPISGYYTNISIWNWSSSSWYELTKKDFTSEADDTLNGVISSGAADFVNSLTKQVVIKVSSRKYILKFSSVSLGEYHTCGVLVNGSVMCWGANWDGMLGDGTTTDRFSPVFINSSESFSSVSAGYEYSCGRLVNGSIMCWGYNSDGQLGIGNTTEMHVPTMVNSSENFTSVSAGAWHACGRLVNGSLMCWGYNYNGQLGDGTTTDRHNPTYVDSSENFTSVSAGYVHTCGSLVNGSLMCWGYNGDGELGIGNTTEMHVPTMVNSSENFTSVSAGSYHTCGRLVNGSLMCWGDNWDGRLGIGNTTSMFVPTMVNSSENFSSVSAGNGDYGPTCGVLINESAMCWGYNYNGQLGDGTTTDRHNPTYVNSNENFSSVSAESEHTCGILVNGNAMCWGYNEYGQLGDGIGSYEINPVSVESSESFMSVSAGMYHTCGRLANGSLMCWGRGSNGQLGYGSTSDKYSPYPVNSSENFSLVSAGNYHTCGRLINGSLMCWGRGSSGQLGYGGTTQQNNSVYVNSSENFTSVSAGNIHTCGRLVNGSLMCWGYNNYGQLGDGTTVQRNNSVYVKSSENFTSVSAGISLNYYATCGVLVNGSLMCWGNNQYGQLGIGNTTTMYVPTMVKSSENFTLVSVGDRHTCGSLVNGSLMCWGYNYYGQLGIGSSDSSSHTTPLYVNSSENFTSVFAGAYHTCGTLVNGSAMCWGRNDYGQIGDGTTTQRNNPVYVNSNENFTSVSAGYDHTCGRLVNGSIMCWGYNYYGQLGNGNYGYKLSPVYVVYSYSPFLYAFKDEMYEFVSDFIAGASSPEKEYTSFIDVTNSFEVVEGRIKFKITEEMDETAYIDRVYLRVDSGLESERIIEMDSITNTDIELLRYSDDNYLVIEKGAEHYIEFNAPNDYSTIEFASEGYYIQHSDYTEKQVEVNSFSSVPTPVPYVSHNSVHTDYIKLEFPAMGIFTILPNTAPTIIANVTKPNIVYTNTDWMLNLTVTDSNVGDTLTAYTQFYVNGTSSGSEHSLVVSNNTNTNVANLSNSDFCKGATLIAEFWAGDATVNTTKYNSTQVTVLNSLPSQVTLSYPENNYSSFTNRTPRFNWTAATDADNDQLTYHLHVSLKSDMSDNTVNETGISNTYYIRPSEFDFHVYYWRVRANDSSDGYGDWSDTWNFTLIPLVSIILINDSINFGTMAQFDTNDTTDNEPEPFRLENNGNTEANISVSSSSLWQSSSAQLNTSYYQFKAGNSSEPNSFNWLSSQIIWSNMSDISKSVIDTLNHTDSNDLAEIEIWVEVASDELPGSKSANLIFYAQDLS